MKYHQGWKHQPPTDPNLQVYMWILISWSVVALACLLIQLNGLNRDTQRNWFFPNYSHNRQDWIDREFRSAGLNPEYAKKIMLCESKGDENAINYNGRYGTDNGLWQINSKYHPEVSRSCAYNWKCSTLATIQIVKQNGWKQWVCSKFVKEVNV